MAKKKRGASAAGSQEDRFKRLMEVAGEAEQAELAILHNAVIDCAKAYRAGPTAGRKRDWDAATKGLQEAVARLWRRYFEDGEEAFPNLLAVASFLSEDGWKCKKSKLYADARNGLIRQEGDGSVLRREAEAYAVRYLKRLGDGEDAGAALTRKRQELEAEVLKEKLASLRAAREREDAGWIRFEDFEQELAARAVILENGFRSMIRRNAPEWLTLGGGDLRKLPVVMEAMEVALEEVLGGYATLERFQVLIVDDEEGEDDDNG